MDEPHLLVAEVDKIQSFVQRSARLKEVVGASYLLVEFCERLPSRLEIKHQVLTSAGGSFRLVFPTLEDALRGRQLLHKAFHSDLTGSITLAMPVSYDSSTPDAVETSLKAGYAAMQRAKRAGQPPEPVWHQPVQAICSSCGIEQAVDFTRSKYEDQPERYLCRMCLSKSETAEEKRPVLFHKLQRELQMLRENIRVDLFKKPFEAETYAQGWDTYNRVAYLVSDGNNMGILFSKCNTPQKLQALSVAVSRVTEHALAQAVEGMMAQHVGTGHEMPVLPLIMGGDDLFALLPAPWAIDVARRYCLAYEDGMNAALDEIGIAVLDADDKKLRATTGVAVVICKANYPYKAAYQHAHTLMEETKDHAKQIGTSMLTIDEITGSTLPDHHSLPGIYSLDDAKKLIDQRLYLKSIPTTLLARLRSQLDMGDDLTPILRHLSRRRPKMHKKLKTSLMALGDEKPLSDLLNLWDFAYDLDMLKENYAKEYEDDTATV